MSSDVFVEVFGATLIAIDQSILYICLFCYICIQSQFRVAETGMFTTSVPATFPGNRITLLLTRLSVSSVWDLLICVADTEIRFQLHRVN